MTDTQDGATAILNVRVFDGDQLLDARTVVFQGGVISQDETVPDGAEIVDARGGVLLPGLIDAHIHLDSRDNLVSASRWGVTTMIDMGTQSLELIDSLRNQPGLTDIMSVIYPAAAPGDAPTAVMGYPESSAATGPTDAARLVAQRVSEGADYIKIVIEDPKMPGTVPMDDATVRALVAEARAHNLQTVAHAVTVDSFQQAVNTGVDIITHAPLDGILSPTLAAEIAENSTPVTPTLVMMQAISERIPAPPPGAPRRIDFAYSLASVRALHEAGVAIVAGTDANDQEVTVAQVPHGEGLHAELELLVSAGLSPVEALNSATSAAAREYRLPDRGRIGAGLRADLLLVTGDPTTDITATRNIEAVWIAGVRVSR